MSFNALVCMNCETELTPFNCSQDDNCYRCDDCEYDNQRAIKEWNEYKDYYNVREL